MRLSRGRRKKKKRFHSIEKAKNEKNGPYGRIEQKRITKRLAAEALSLCTDRKREHRPTRRTYSQELAVGERTQVRAEEAHRFLKVRHRAEG